MANGEFGEDKNYNSPFSPFAGRMRRQTVEYLSIIREFMAQKVGLHEGSIEPTPPVLSVADCLYEFLTARLEIVPLGRCENPTRYSADEPVIFSAFDFWMRHRRLTTPTHEDLHRAMQQLFPAPHAEFNSETGHWWGFRFEDSSRVAS